MHRKLTLVRDKILQFYAVVYIYNEKYDLVDAKGTIMNADTAEI